MARVHRPDRRHGAREAAARVRPSRTADRRVPRHGHRIRGERGGQPRSRADRVRGASLLGRAARAECSAHRLHHHVGLRRAAPGQQLRACIQLLRPCQRLGLRRHVVGAGGRLPDSRQLDYVHRAAAGAERQLWRGWGGCGGAGRLPALSAAPRRGHLRDRSDVGGGGTDGAVHVERDAAARPHRSHRAGAAARRLDDRDFAGRLHRSGESRAAGPAGRSGRRRLASARGRSPPGGDGVHADADADRRPRGERAAGVRRGPRARQQHGVPLAGAHRGPDRPRERLDAVRREFRIRHRLRDVDPHAARAADGAGAVSKRRHDRHSAR